MGCLNEAVELRRVTHGAEHAEYAAALCSLADLLSDLKQYDAAVPRFEEALAIRRALLGEQHPLTLRLVRDLEQARQNLDAVLAQEAAKEQERARRLETRRRELLAREEALRIQQQALEEAEVVEERCWELERTKNLMEARRREVEERRREAERRRK